MVFWIALESPKSQEYFVIKPNTEELLEASKVTVNLLTVEENLTTGRLLGIVTYFDVVEKPPLSSMAFKIIV